MSPSQGTPQSPTPPKQPGIPRPTLLTNPRSQPLLIALFAVLFSILAISLLLLALGKNPLAAFQGMLQGSGIIPKPRYAGGKNMLTDLLGLLDAMTPMLFAALAVAIAFKAGLFNIGVSGQMLLSGFLATVLVGYSGLSAGLAKPLVLLIGLLAGGLLGTFVGILKARFNIHEVVSTIMLNYILQSIVSFFIKSSFVDPVSRQSRAISAASRLTLTDVSLGDVTTRIPLGFLIAVAIAILLYILLKNTSLGFELRAVGTNKKAAHYSGIKSNRTVITAMALSGCCAGLAGVTYYLGYFATIEPGALTTVGFDSIAVALLANSNPVACVLSSLLITVMTYGSTYMSSVANVSAYIAQLMVGIVLLFCACAAYVKHRIERRGITRLETKGINGEADGPDSPRPSPSSPQGGAAP
ncbi:MAG: ABC transporter permease [Coriobacteriales bacterium]|jgi:simple sugar transport system permease protein|nr:ABC transporter permease [Coriobacteriales bacterium]